WLIELCDYAVLSANVTILTHDAIYYLVTEGNFPYRFGKVTVKSHTVVCPNSIIMPGVTIGAHSVIALGSLVNKDVPDGVIVAGCPAKALMTVEQGLANNWSSKERYVQEDRASKYPWRI